MSEGKKRWIVSEQDYMSAVEKIWDHYPFVQALLGAKLYEQLMTDLANLTFKVEVPEGATLMNKDLDYWEIPERGEQ